MNIEIKHGSRVFVNLQINLIFSQYPVKKHIQSEARKFSGQPMREQGNCLYPKSRDLAESMWILRSSDQHYDVWSVAQLEKIKFPPPP